MARFLSPAWLDELAAAAAGSDQLRRAAAGVDLSVRHVVLDGPDGDVSYSFRLAGGEVSVAGDGGDGADEADVEMASDYSTAAAISRGELSPAVAVAAGRVRLKGRVALLGTHQEVFAGLGDLFGPVRASTEY